MAEPAVAPPATQNVEPGHIPGVSPGEAAQAKPPTAVSGNPFDAFDRGLAKPEEPKPKADAPPPPEDKPATPPAPPSPFDPDKLTPDFKPKAEHWKTVNAERTRLKEELATLKKQMDELGDITTLKNIAAEKAELEKQLRMVAAERDPAVQKEFAERQAVHIEEARNAVPTELAEQVTAILKRHGSAAAPHLRGLIKEHDLDAFAQSQLAAAIAGLRSVEQNRERIAKESAENWNKLVTEQKLAAQRQQEQYTKELQSTLISQLEEAKKSNVLFQPVNEEDAPDVEEAVNVAQRVAQGDLDIHERVNVAMMAGAYPRLVKAYMRLHGEFKSLQDTAQKLRGMQPGGGGVAGAPGSGPAPTGPAGRGNDAGDIFLKGLREQGL